MKALILDAENQTANVQEIPKPSPAPNEILVRVSYIALNPVDSLYTAHPLGKSGRVVGSDFAGTVAQLGSSVPSSSPVKIDTRVAGFLQGACSRNDRPGAFAEYLVIPHDLVWIVPDAVTLESAAGVSLVALTAAQGVWYRLGMYAPFEWDKKTVFQEHPEWMRSRLDAGKTELDTFNFFVYGASTSVGLYAAQLVRLGAEANQQRLKLFGAASPGRFDWLKEQYKYEELVNYRDHDWSEQVKNLVGDKGIHYAYDGFSEGDTVQHISDILAPDGRMAIVRSRAAGAWNAEHVTSDPAFEPIYGAVWEGLGAEIQYQAFTVPESKTARDFAVLFYRWLGDVAGKELVLNPVRSMPGGLDAVVRDGYALLGSGKMGEREERTEEWMRPISAEKLVYKIGEEQ